LPPSWYPKVTVVEHSNLTAKMAIEIARLAKDAYGISVNMDCLIAAILHDACLLLERKRTEPEEVGTSVKSDMGKVMHARASDIGKYTARAFVGTHECLAAGLPRK
jgi:HD superfamily phosphohydrolase YqeK